MSRVALYSRQSHDNRASIARQDEECLADCAAQGWPAPAMYSDGSSASPYATKGRDDWDRLLADVRRGAIQVLLLWESSRGDRTLTSWSALLDLCKERRVLIRVKTHNRTYDMRNPRDWRTLAEDGVDNQYDSDKTSLRLKATMKMSAADGKPHGATPFGYLREYDARTRKLIIQRPDWATEYLDAQGVRHERVDRRGEPWSPAGVVTGMFEDALAMVPTSAILRSLNDRGIPTPRQHAAMAGLTPLSTDRWRGEWTYTVVRDLLRNPAYVGTRTHNPEWKTEPGRGEVTKRESWPALIEPEPFYALQQHLRDPARKTNNGENRAKYLLSAHSSVTCANCGGVLAHLPAKSTGYGARHPSESYRCKARNCVACHKEDLDGLVEAMVLHTLTDQDMLAMVLAADDNGPEVVAARAEMARLEVELRDVQARIEVASMATLDALGRRAERLADELAKARARLAPVGDRSVLLPYVGLETDAALARWGVADIAVRREIIRQTTVVTVMPAGRGRRVPLTERVTIGRPLASRR